jgi:tetratricopeptide (TPR) repeat protein
MKAERRHELKHNELSDWLGQWVEALKPHATGVLLGLVLLGAMVMGGVWYFSGESQTAARSWSRYFASFNEREPQKALEELAQQQSGSTAAWWALMSVGDMHLGQGAALLYSDRAEAQKHLEQAKAAYLRVEAAEAPLLKNRARLGLAKVYESLCQPDDARKYYEQVASNDKASAIGKAAAADAIRLKDPREIAFLEWFVKQTPKRPAPLPGFGGAIPGLPNDLPERPDISLPKNLGLDSIGATPPAAPGPSFPAPGISPTPSDSVPTESKSGDAPAPAAAPEPGKPTVPDAVEKKPD